MKFLERSMFEEKVLRYPAPINDAQKKILSPEALEFVFKLNFLFQANIEKQLLLRHVNQHKINSGGSVKGFSQKTLQLSNDDWVVSDLPQDLLDRRVEITGPVDRKMIINALNSGANVFMADFEDSTSPTWENLINGQVNLYDAVRKQITYTDINKNKNYSLNDNTAVLFVRPRGFHLSENHITINGRPVLGCLVDFGLYFFHNAHELLRRNTGPYFYLPKLENRLEAKLWNNIFVEAQKLLDIPQSTIKATVLIETITAATEMDEILYELKEHSAGLNCGRWDYIFSFIKRFGQGSTAFPELQWPDRNNITMEQPFMRAYTQWLVKTCHKRNVHAIGGMSAFIPVKGDEEKNDAAFRAIQVDKIREVTDGHDGTWVAHPALVGYVKNIFDYYIPEKNQIDNKRDDLTEMPTAELLKITDYPVEEKNIKTNLSIAFHYICSWLLGRGCVPMNNMMEDAATAEISRALIWSWIKNDKVLSNGSVVTKELVSKYLNEIFEENNSSDDTYTVVHVTRNILEKLCLDTEHFHEFLTTLSYESLVAT